MESQECKCGEETAAESCGGCGCGSDLHGEHTDGRGTLYRIIASAVFFAAALIVGAAGGVRDGRPDSPIAVIRFALVAVSFLLAGFPVLLNAVKNIFRGEIFDENFLMTIASVGAFVIGEYPEAAAVMLFYQIGEYFQEYALGKSRRSISALMELRPDTVGVVRGGTVLTVAPETVSPGELIEVRPGERIALDGVVESGSSFVDTSALTGESVPREVAAGDEVLGGCINTNGVLRIRTSKSAGDSAIARILDLVEHAGSKKAVTERFITRFAKVYTPLVTVSAVLLAVVPPLVVSGAEWSTWVSRALIFLVVSCPCALVISVPLGFFGGIGAASRRGILVKGSNYLEALARTGTAVFDKTGTLTKGVFKVTAVHPADPVRVPARELVALAAHAEKYSNHPISVSLKNAHTEEMCGDCSETSCDCCAAVSLSDVKEISGQGISAVLDGRAVLVGNNKLMRAFTVTGFSDVGDDVRSPEACAAADGGTVVHVAVDGSYAGHIVISDEVKSDAAQAIAALKSYGVKRTVMLTGDTEVSGRKTAEMLGIDTVYADLMPGDKVAKVEALLAAAPGGSTKRETLLFAGDGINDAPVLARADVGIAMGALGSDAAIEAADMVIMTDEPSKIPEAVGIARKTRRIVMQNIVFALGVKALILLLGAAGFASMWAAVFADVGVSFLAVLNSMRLLARKSA